MLRIYPLLVCLFMSFSVFSLDSHRSHSDATERDMMLCDMNAILMQMEACQKAKNAQKQYGMEGHSTPDIQLASYLKELRAKLKIYPGLRCGVSKPNLWKVYNMCNHIAGYPVSSKHVNYSLLSAPRKSLLSLAEKYVNQSVAQISESDEDFKLGTLFREDTRTNLKKLLQESFTLAIPLGRALKATEEEKKGKNFIAFFLRELSQEYWRDDSLSEVAKLLKIYFEYEFLLARADESLVRRYPYLMSVEADSFAQQFLAQFLSLSLIQPFLVENKVPAQQVKEYTSLESLAIDWEKKGESFAQVSPHWYKVIQILINESPQFSRSSSNYTDQSTDFDEISDSKNVLLARAESRSKLLERDIRQDYGAFIPKNNISPKQLGFYIDNYSGWLALYRASVMDTREIVSTYVQIMVNSPNNDFEFSNLYSKFAALQEIIRGLDYWHAQVHDTIFDKPYTGDLSGYIEKFNEGNWIEKINFFICLDGVADKDQKLNDFFKALGQILAEYASYLSEPELIRLLEKYAELKWEKEFNIIANLLEEISIISSNPDALRNVVASNRSQFENTPRIFAGDMEWTVPTKKIIDLKKYSSQLKRIKISMPIDKGIGEVVKTLQSNTWFNGAESRLLMMVARLAVPKLLHAKKALYKQGAEADSFALITEGQLEVIVYQDNRGKTVATLGKGDSVGDMSLFVEQGKRTATVKAIETTTIYEISKEAFKRLMSVKHELMRFMFAQLVQKAYNGEKHLQQLGLSLENNSNSLMKSLSHEEVRSFTRYFQSREGKVGKCLVAAGKKAEKLIYIDDGEASLSDNRENEIGKLRYGDYYSEIAFLAEGTYPFKMQVCGGHCFYSTISQKDFKKFLKKHPGALVKMAAVLTDRIMQINKCLKDTNVYALQRACEEGNIPKLKEIIAESVELDAPLPVFNNADAGFRAIHIAAQHNRIEVVKLLLKHNIDIDIVDDFGNSAVHIAARENNVQILEFLKSNKSNMYLYNFQKETPYDVARNAGHQEAMEFYHRFGYQTE